MRHLPAREEHRFDRRLQWVLGVDPLDEAARGTLAGGVLAWRLRMRTCAP